MSVNFDNPTVVARNLGKSFFLTKSGSSRGLIPSSRMTEIRAVETVSFVSYPGESIGILGKNGSGKSTLLRMIAGTEEPSRGEVYVSAKPTLLGVSAALQQSLSGKANIRLGLLAMGLSPNEVAGLEDEVIDWAGLREAIDRPLRTYSSGMVARLKFAIATAMRADILLVDEALSTGDATFAAKAKERMDSFLETAGTVFLVSHGAKTIQEHCTRALWLHDGELIADGHAESITKSYRVWGNRVATGKNEEADEIIRQMKRRFVPKRIIFDSEAADMLDGRGD